jgi:hypothetical protein
MPELARQLQPGAAAMVNVRFRSPQFPSSSVMWRPMGMMLGLALLWVGSGHISVVGLLLMLSGLVLAVGAVAPPRLGRRAAEPTPYSDLQMPANAARGVS